MATLSIGTCDLIRILFDVLLKRLLCVVLMLVESVCRDISARFDRDDQKALPFSLSATAFLV